MKRLPHPVGLRSASIALRTVLSWAVPAIAEDAGRGSIIGRADPLYERGTHFLRTGKVDAAVAELARAVEIAPDDPGCWPATPRR